MATSPNLKLLSTDTLPWFGLDLIFSLAKEAGYDGIDLALWKNFDAWHESYVSKLSRTYDLPVVAVQTSAKINAKELNQAITICNATGANHINIHAPKFFDVKPYTFLNDHLKQYQKDHPNITFSIINPDTSSMTLLPLPKYRFKNIGEIVRKFECNLAFDLANMDEESTEMLIFEEGKEMSDHIAICYFSDRKKDSTHLIPGTGDYNLEKALKFFKKHDYQGHFSIRLSLDPQTLVDNEKVLFSIKKSVEYINDHR